MIRILVSLLLGLLLSGEAVAQYHSTTVLQEIKEGIETEVVNAGCEIIVEIAATEGLVACRIPDPTQTSKFVCGVATYLNTGKPAQDLAVRGCSATYMAGKKTVRIVLSFARGKLEEIAKVLTYFEHNLQATYLQYTLKRP